MATSSFGKNFTVVGANADAFVYEMVKQPNSVLDAGFQSGLKSLHDDTELKKCVKNALETRLDDS